jgi:flagellar biosynthesis protein FlhG
MRNQQAAALRDSGAGRAVVADAPRVVAVTGGKGGVGKSTVALNLAVLRGAQGRALALDGDLGMADLNLLLGVAPERSLLDLLHGTAVEEILVEAHGIHLLPALNGSFLLANLRGPARAQLLGTLAGLTGRFDHVVIDTAAGIGEIGVALAAAATEVIVVTSAEPLAIADAYACLKVLSVREGVRRALILPNSVSSAAQGDEVYGQLRALSDRFLGMELIPLPSIPTDPMVSAAAATGVPLVRLCPDSPAARALRRVAAASDAVCARDRGTRLGCVAGGRP